MDIHQRYIQIYFLHFLFTGVASNLCQFNVRMFRNVAPGSYGEEDVQHQEEEHFLSFCTLGYTDAFTGK